jgi:hypothetical protein
MIQIYSEVAIHQSGNSPKAAIRQTGNSLKQQFTKVAIHQSGNSPKKQFTKAIIYQSGNSSKWLFNSGSFDQMPFHQMSIRVIFSFGNCLHLHIC